jgi:hypothetical protein
VRSLEKCRISISECKDFTVLIINHFYFFIFLSCNPSKRVGDPPQKFKGE